MGLKLMTIYHKALRYFLNVKQNKIFKEMKATAIAAKTEPVIRKGSYTIITREMESMPIKMHGSDRNPHYKLTGEKSVKSHHTDKLHGPNAKTHNDRSREQPKFTF